MGVGTLFALARVSSVVEGIKEAVDGRLLVFFPGEHHPENHTYRLLDARDGWNYLPTVAGPRLNHHKNQTKRNYAEPRHHNKAPQENRLVNNGVAEGRKTIPKPLRPSCATSWRPLFATASTKKGWKPSSTSSWSIWMRAPSNLASGFLGFYGSGKSSTWPRCCASCCWTDYQLPNGATARSLGKGTDGVFEHLERTQHPRQAPWCFACRRWQVGRRGGRQSASGAAWHRVQVQGPARQ